MQAIDGQHNGYRHLLLPIAHRSPLVLAPVLATAAFHMARLETADRSSGLWSSSRLYGQALAELQVQRDLEKADASTRLHILLALLTLLVSVMVNGSDDFPIIFRLLVSALNAMGGEEALGHDELATFIVRQIHKYGTPSSTHEWKLTCVQDAGLCRAVPQ
jgi:hypothetical protein